MPTGSCVPYHATGKLRGVAGARKLKSRLGGMIEPFTLCQLDLFEKPGDSLYRFPRSPSMSHSQSFVPISHL